jgi:hypothetical protein
MSTSLPAESSPPKSAGSTKQLLEELDALMQRMLAIPVNEVAETPDRQNSAEAIETPDISSASVQPGPLEPQVQSEISSPARLSSPPLEIPKVTCHMAAPAVPPPPADLRSDQPEAPGKEDAVLPPPEAVPLGGFWPHPALQGPQWREEAARQPTAPANWSPPPQQRPAQGPVWPLTAIPQPATGLRLRALLWSNRTFDRCTARLGRPGRWLQGPPGRRLVGWLGIGLLAGSVAWGLSNWFDWTW